jgi:outer membrane murein-binding lipoprotein Lpp
VIRLKRDGITIAVPSGADDARVVIRYSRKSMSDERLVRIEAKIDHLTSRGVTVDTNIHKVTVRVDRLDAKVEKLTERVDGLETKVDGLDIKVDKLTSRVDGLDAKVGNLKSSVEGLDSRVLRLTIMQEDLRDDVKRVADGVAGADGRFDRIERSLDELKSMMASFYSDSVGSKPKAQSPKPRV